MTDHHSISYLKKNKRKKSSKILKDSEILICRWLYFTISSRQNTGIENQMNLVFTELNDFFEKHPTRSFSRDHELLKALVTAVSLFSFLSRHCFDSNSIKKLFVVNISGGHFHNSASDCMCSVKNRMRVSRISRHRSRLRGVNIVTTSRLANSRRKSRNKAVTTPRNMSRQYNNPV